MTAMMQMTITVTKDMNPVDMGPWIGEFTELRKDRIDVIELNFCHGNYVAGGDGLQVAQVTNHPLQTRSCATPHSQSRQPKVRVGRIQDPGKFSTAGAHIHSHKISSVEKGIEYFPRKNKANRASGDARGGSRCGQSRH